MPKADAPSPRRRSTRRGKLPVSSISTVLNQVVGKFGLESRMKEHAFMSVWTDVVDEPFKNCSRPLYLDHEGCLVVSVKDAAVAQELSFIKSELVRRLFPFARAIGLKIRGIRFDLKHFKEIETEVAEAMQALSKPASAASLPDDGELSAIDLDDESLNNIEALKENLGSDMLQSRIIKLYERQLRLALWREQQGSPSCSSCGFREDRLYGKHNQCRNCYVSGLLSSVNKVQD